MKTNLKIALSIYIFLSIVILDVYAQQQQSFSGCQVCNGSSINNFHWELIGTKNEHDSNGMGEGIVQKILVDKHDPSGNTIYVGSRFGGLWRTKGADSTGNGAPHWTCLTENLRLPGLGVNDIAIHPDSPNVIYISATNNSICKSTPEFGMGIIKSIDGGVTWFKTGLTSNFNTISNYNPITTQGIFISPYVDSNGARAVFAFSENKIDF